MSKKEKHRFLPLLAVIVCGFGVAILIRLLLIEGGRDNGTANLTFILVFAGFILAYLLFMVAWEPFFLKVFGKRLTPEPRPKDLPKDDTEASEIVLEPAQEKTPAREEESAVGPGEEWICDDVTPEIGEYEKIEPVHQPEPKTAQSDWKELHEKEVRAKLSLFLEYSHLTMGPYVTEEELSRLDEYIELFARQADLPTDIKPLRPARLKNPDLYHFGWNMQYYFQVGKREDVVPWLQSVFSELKGLSFSTIKGKLHDYQTEKYIIPNIDDIPKYMAEKRA